jgi:uncharacterized RDD family membrane protein YckC/DNA-binding HxlR family transcriptional regulator
MVVDQDNVSRILSVLSHPIRREILLDLSEKGELSFTDMMKALNVDTGKLSFHIRNLSAFLEQTPAGQYQLSKAGENAVRIVKDVESWAEAADELIKRDSVLPLASWKKRAKAFAIDLSLMILIPLFISLPNLFSMSIGGPFSVDISLMILMTLGLLWGYSTLLEGFEGQTLGKRVEGLKVVRIDGKRLSYDYAAIRNFGKAFLLPFDLLFGVRLNDKRYVRYFDKFLCTTVVDIRVSRDAC